MKNKLKRLFRKETGTWVLAGITMLFAVLSLYTSNLLYRSRNVSISPAAPESQPAAAGNCTLTYSIPTPTPTSGYPSCPPGTSLLFNRALSSMTTGTTLAANGRVSSLSGSWRVNLQNNVLLARDGSRITVTFPTNVLLDSALVFDNDPKTGETLWTINGVSLPRTSDNAWGSLFRLNLTTNQMVFNNGGDSPHFNVCVKTLTSTTPTVTSVPTPTSSSGGSTSGQIAITEDGYVRSGAPNTVYNGTSLYTNATQEKVIYIKLDLTSLAGRTVNSANLNLYVTDINTNTVYVKSVSGNWSETTLTYNNRPALGSTITSFTSPSSASTWKSINLTSFVNQYKGQVVSIAIQATKLSDDLIFRSSESSGNKPYLSIQ